MPEENEEIELPRFSQQIALTQNWSHTDASELSDGATGVLKPFSGLLDFRIVSGYRGFLDLTYLVLRPFVVEAPTRPNGEGRPADPQETLRELGVTRRSGYADSPVRSHRILRTEGGRTNRRTPSVSNEGAEGEETDARGPNNGRELKVYQLLRRTFETKPDRTIMPPGSADSGTESTADEPGSHRFTNTNALRRITGFEPELTTRRAFSHEPGGTGDDPRTLTETERVADWRTVPRRGRFETRLDHPTLHKRRTGDEAHNNSNVRDIATVEPDRSPVRRDDSAVSDAPRREERIADTVQPLVTRLGNEDVSFPDVPRAFVDTGDGRNQGHSSVDNEQNEETALGRLDADTSVPLSVREENTQPEIRHDRDGDTHSARGTASERHPALVAPTTTLSRRLLRIERITTHHERESISTRRNAMTVLRAVTGEAGRDESLDIEAPLARTTTVDRADTGSESVPSDVPSPTPNPADIGPGHVPELVFRRDEPNAGTDERDQFNEGPTRNTNSTDEHISSHEKDISQEISSSTRRMDTEVDIDRLTDRLYAKLERKMRIERERRGR